ncbi:MAG: hypothetical protein ACN2B6_08935 [Rickettsiales bacterium]
MTIPAVLGVLLFFFAACVLTGFTLYAHRAGKIRSGYTAIAGALLGIIFSMLIALFTGDLPMSSAVGLVIFAWFLMFSRQQKQTKRLFDNTNSGT